MTNGTSSSNGSSAFLSGSSAEEISTIFVVGFPDDMQEREFQNMFIFSPGFEAATLKIPSKDQDDDMASASNSNNNGRKQIIGFAKFRTRFEALEAKDILSGRRVDAEKGSVLKAEMAKKNLHTKRGLSSDQQQAAQQQPPSSQQPPPPIVPMSTSSYPIIPQQSQQTSKRFSMGPSAAYEAFHSVPPGLPSDTVPPSELSYPDYYQDVFSPGGTPIAPSFHDSVFAARAAPPSGPPPPFDTRSASMGDIFMPSSSRLPSGFNPGHRYSSKSVMLDMDHPKSPTERSNVFGAPMFLPPQQPSPAPASTSSTSQPSSSSFLPPPQPFSSPPPSSLNSVLEEAYPLQLNDDNNDLSSRFGGLSISTSTTITNNGGLPSPGITSPTGFRSFGALGAVSTNPADQNPPCNTLYVGNLPPNASEEELKNMFSSCVGYQRLSFRNKPNGPMCFVEFEDIACATQAMQELYGNPLSNSVKGGIRLSFSKNPLVSCVR
ncbi:hypothetical protein BJV82DRAFT_643667 [Fennellomyces sp. T-0311]|nr:hypothetical protein BJV82DRAFT_643667 [Fennellomyces sp. T-0311]